MWLVAGALCALPVCGAVYQLVGEAVDRRRYPPPGAMVRIGGTRLHANVQGRSRPAVVFEAGIAASSLSWASVQPEVAQTNLTVSYDRFGLGWSRLGRAPLTLQAMVESLDVLLQSLGIAPPYVLVGHSFGGLLVRAFAQAHPGKVAGLVLVDPVSLEAWAPCPPPGEARLRAGTKLSRRGAWLARLGVVRLALALARWQGARISTRIARATAGQAMPQLGRLIREVAKLPPAVVPAVRAGWSCAKSFKAMARHLEALPACAAAALELAGPSGIPMIILSAATATDNELAERDEWIQRNGQGRQMVVPETGHWLHLERPDLVVEAALELARETPRPDC